MRRAPLSGLIRAAWRLARSLPDPEHDDDLAAFCIHLRLQEGRDARDLPTEIWENHFINEIVNAIVEGWDSYGAPSVAKSPTGGYIGSAEGPGGGFVIHAESKRRAYEQARREWLKRILAARLGLGKKEE
jgi:hypothetical protein